MKKNRFFILGMLAAALAFGFALAGCDPEKDDPPNGDKAVFVGDFPNVDYIDAFKQRFTNRVNEVSDDVKIVVLSGDYPTNGDAIGAIKAAYNAGAVIVLIKPTAAQEIALTDVIEHKSTLVHNTGSEPVYDMYAFNKFDDHYILSMGSAFPEYDHNGNLVTPAETMDPKPFIDAVVAWIDAHDNGEKGAVPQRTARSATDDVQNMMNAQTITLSYAGTTSRKLGDILCNPIVITDQYYIWAVYDFDHQEEYYIVQEDITIPSAGLGYRVNYSYDDWKWTGFYLHDFVSNHIPQKSGQPLARDTEVLLVSQSPLSANNTTTVTTSTTWGVNASLGFSGMGGTGSVGVSASFTSSTGRNISDFSVTNYCETPLNSLLSTAFTGGYTSANTVWLYKMGEESVVGPKFSSGNLGDAPLLARSTAVWTNEWVWRMPTDLNSTTQYSMQVEAQGSVGTFSESNGHDTLIDIVANHLGQYSGQVYNQTVNLTPPPRTRPQGN